MNYSFLDVSKFRKHQLDQCQDDAKSLFLPTQIISEEEEENSQPTEYLIWFDHT